MRKEKMKGERKYLKAFESMKTFFGKKVFKLSKKLQLG